MKYNLKTQHFRAVRKLSNNSFDNEVWLLNGNLFLSLNKQQADKVLEKGINIMSSYTLLNKHIYSRPIKIRARSNREEHKQA